MKRRKGVALIITLAMAIWTASVFFKSVDENVLWKSIASGIGFLVFGSFFVMSWLKAMKEYKAQYKTRQH